jgi:hypothetical protein
LGIPRLKDPEESYCLVRTALARGINPKRKGVQPAMMVLDLRVRNQINSSVLRGCKNNRESTPSNPISLKYMLEACVCVSCLRYGTRYSAVERRQQPTFHLARIPASSQVLAIPAPNEATSGLWCIFLGVCPALTWPTIGVRNECDTVLHVLSTER